MAFTMSVAEVIAADTTGLLAKHDSWERAPLAEVAEILNGAPFDSSLFSSTRGTPLVRIRDVLSGETKTFYMGTYDAMYLVKQGDLLIGMDGDFNCGYWGGQLALLNQRVCKVTPNDASYDKRFLVHVLPGYLAAINANTPSVTVKHLSSKTVGEIDLPLPPRAEQTRIVAKLEELLSDLDAGMAELKAAQKKLQQYRQSLLKAAVEGALTAAWREAQRAANAPLETGAQLLERILRERRARWEEKQLAKFGEQGKTPPKDWQKKYSEPVAPDTSGLPELPDGWAWGSLDQLLSQLRSGTAETSTRELTPYPVLKSSAVRHGKIDFGALNYLRADQCRNDDYLEDGDLLISRLSGSVEYVGCCAVVQAVPPMSVQYPDRIFCGKLSSPSQHLAIHVVNTLRSPSARIRIEAAAKSTAGHKRISLSDLRPFPVPLPPLAEMAALGEIVQTALNCSDDMEAALALARKQSTAQRQNILRAAFAGQLVPQDPNDEPASVLLERIRSERAAQAAKKKPRGRKKEEAVA